MGTSSGKKKRTLQLLIDEGSPYVEYFDWFLKAHVYAPLTHNWHLILAAGLPSSKSNLYLKNLFDLLELDWHCQWCLVCLANSGLPGATHFAHLMWSLLKKMACKKPYEDISHWVTNLVKLCRTRFDQPPDSYQGEEHCDKPRWGWSKLFVPHCLVV